MSFSIKSISAETLFALSALVVSVCAIVISLVEVNVMQDQKQASVWPHVVNSRSVTGDVFKIQLRNAGVGPAIIKYVEVRVDGKPVKDWLQARARLGLKGSKGFSTTTMTNNVIVPGQAITPFSNQGPDSAQLASAIERIRMRVCYCSIYDQCWQIDEASSPKVGLFSPTRVETCGGDEGRQFSN